MTPILLAPFDTAPPELIPQTGVPRIGGRKLVEAVGVTDEELWTFLSIGAFSENSLPGVTALTINAVGSREGFDIERAQDLASISFPRLVSVTNGSNLGLVANSQLSAISVPLLEEVGNLVITDSPALTSLEFPSLVTAATITISGCAALTAISLPSFMPSTGDYLGSPRVYNFQSNALSADSVNAILARCVANGAFVSAVVELSGGTNAAPTGQGLLDLATLRNRGVTVNVNS